MDRGVQHRPATLRPRDAATDLSTSSLWPLNSPSEEGSMSLSALRTLDDGVILAGLKAKPFGWPPASLDTRTIQ